MSLDFSHIKGDTFDEVNFEVKINNVALNLTGAVIKMQLRKNAYDHVTTPALSLTSVASAGITITQPTLGRFKINSQIIDIEVFNYSYDIQITLSSGVVKTYINGFFDVIIDVTI
jgi:hypothetical protein